MKISVKRILIISSVITLIFIIIMLIFIKINTPVLLNFSMYTSRAGYGGCIDYCEGTEYKLICTDKQSCTYICFGERDNPCKDKL